LPLLGWIIVFTAVGGIASAAFAGLFLLLPEQTGLRMLPHFVSFATGALIGAALLGLLPEAMESVGPGGAHSIGIALVVGLGVFFIIEKLVLWRHAHSHEHEDPVSRDVVAHGVTDSLAHDDGDPSPVQPAIAFAGDLHGDTDVLPEMALSGVALSEMKYSHAGHDHGSAHHHPLVHDHGSNRGADRAHARPSPSGFDAHGHDHSRDGAAGVLVLIGDSIHNTLDGILIAAAFLTSVPLGLVTTLAVAAHEIPHRVGDFALLLHAGMSRQRAMFLNMATGLASVLGGIVAYFGLSKAQHALPYALALAAAGFLYIAVAGLIPGLHRRADPGTSLAQVLLMGMGVAVIAVAESLTH
jgi:zinc and cadmium transporter